MFLVHASTVRSVLVSEGFIEKYRLVTVKKLIREHCTLLVVVQVTLDNNMCCF
jgi:hypothetical protein